jgi:glutamine phosphoribosylpyrophosphate amidotransferase
MCGIAGILAKSPDVPVAQSLSSMLHALRRRGPDSAGMALYQAPTSADVGVLTLYSRADPSQPDHPTAGSLGSIIDRYGGLVAFDGDHDGYLRMKVMLPFDDPARLGELTEDIETRHGAGAVFSIGRSLELVKGVSDATELFTDFDLGRSSYTHAIGHVRLATESRVDVAHSHPFWARPFADVTVVHNGHITNYHKLRRIYEQHGARFATDNDSEFIGRYVAGQLQEGVSLEEAVTRSITEIDGSFTYLVATTDGVAVARDRYGSKPCVIAEAEDWICIASEELALRATFIGDADYDVSELPAGETRTWRI